jgi:hypothetical protein
MENDPLKTFKKKRAMKFFRSKGQHKSQLHAISIEKDKKNKNRRGKSKKRKSKKFDQRVKRPNFV